MKLHTFPNHYQTITNPFLNIEQYKNKNKTNTLQIQPKWLKLINLTLLDGKNLPLRSAELAFDETVSKNDPVIICFSTKKE